MTEFEVKKRSFYLFKWSCLVFSQWNSSNVQIQYVLKTTGGIYRLATYSVPYEIWSKVYVYKTKTVSVNMHHMSLESHKIREVLCFYTANARYRIWPLFQGSDRPVTFTNYWNSVLLVECLLNESRISQARLCFSIYPCWAVPILAHPEGWWGNCLVSADQVQLKESPTSGGDSLDTTSHSVFFRVKYDSLIREFGKLLKFWYVSSSLGGTERCSFSRALWETASTPWGLLYALEFSIQFLNPIF